MSNIIEGYGPPSRHCKGEVGQHYTNLENGDVYECISASEHSKVNLHTAGGYIWKKIADGDHLEVCKTVDTNEPHQMLVTNEAGEQVWEPKLCYSTYEPVAIFNEYTIVNDDGKTVKDQKIAADVIVGEEYIVTYNGKEYKVVAYEHDFFGTSLGNDYLGMGENDTGEPFYFGNLIVSMSQILCYFDKVGTHTFSIRGAKENSVPIPGKYVGGGVYPGEGVGATVIGSTLAGASGDYSVALNSSQASGVNAHAEGFGHAEGDYSHSEGRWTYAMKESSHAEGLYTYAYGANQHVQGKYNVHDNDGVYAHIVGNGTGFNERSNAHTLDWSGNGWFAGTVEGTAMILKSSTEGSTKRFKVTVNDSGTLTAVEI